MAQIGAKHILGRGNAQEIDQLFTTSIHQYLLLHQYSFIDSLIHHEDRTFSHCLGCQRRRMAHGHAG
jgi:hypothetical protein